MTDTQTGQQDDYYHPLPHACWELIITINNNNYNNNWRVSGASDTQSGVTQYWKSGIFVCLCVDVRMSFCTLTLSYFCVSLVFDTVPNFTKLNPLVYRLLPVLSQKLNCLPLWILLRVHLKLKKLTGVPFLFELVVMVIRHCHSHKPYAAAFTWKFIVHYSNYEGKSCVGMSSCVKILCYSYYLAKEYHKEKV